MNSQQAHCSLNTGLKNTAVVAGQRMEMECCVDRRSMAVREWKIQWSPNTMEYLILNNWFGKLRFNSNFTRFGTNIDQNDCFILYLNSSKVSDAGIYSCIVQNNTGTHLKNYSAQLIVLAKEPKCESNLTANTSLEEGDTFWMQCSVIFSGVWRPSMKWIQHNRDGTVLHKAAASEVTNSSILSVFFHTVSLVRGPYYISCQIYFDENNGNLFYVSAKNAPSYNYNWTFPAIKINIPISETQTKATDEQKHHPESFVYIIVMALLSIVILIAIICAACCIFCICKKRSVAQMMVGFMSHLQREIRNEPDVVPEREATHTGILQTASESEQSFPMRSMHSYLYIIGDAEEQNNTSMPTKDNKNVGTICDSTYNLMEEELPLYSTLRRTSEG